MPAPQIIADNVVIVNNLPLKLFAHLLISEGMFDSHGGRYSGLLVNYQNSLLNNNYKTSFIMMPNVGIVILNNNTLNCYVNYRLRGKGYSTKLMEFFIQSFGLQTAQLAEKEDTVKHIIVKALTRDLSAIKLCTALCSPALSAA